MRFNRAIERLMMMEAAAAPTLIQHLKMIVEVRRMGMPANIKYAGPEDLILQFGHIFEPSGDTPGRVGEQGNCFQDSYRISQSHSEYTYCEGFAYKAGLIPLEHAWVTKDNIVALDPTWHPTAKPHPRLARPQKEKVADDWFARNEYYGIPFDAFPSHCKFREWRISPRYPIGYFPFTRRFLSCAEMA